MTIRSRLTLWYVAVLCGSLLLMGGLSYYEMVIEPRQEHKAKPEQAAVQREVESDFSDLLKIILFCGLPAALLGLAGGAWLTYKALKPIATLTTAAERVTDRSLHTQLPRTGSGDELDRLTDVFNAMTARLDASFQRIREFTLHASHELKTPLTVMRAELENALAEPDLSSAARERLHSQIEEVDRLTKIVDGLTLLTKADAGQVPLARETVRVDELVRDASDDAKMLAASGNINVELTACDVVTLQGDRNRLRQLLLNLTDNAIKYNQPNGRVVLTLSHAGTKAVLTVENTGAGLSPELQAQVFEPFFRGDASHSNTVEGCGLGLSIARWIVTAHGGTIRFASAPSGLTTVTVSLPLMTDASRQEPSQPDNNLVKPPP